MKTYRLPNTGIQAEVSRIRPTSSFSPKASLWMAGSAFALLACAGLTVFASARVMLSSHDLASLHAAQSATQQEIRFLETEYASVSSLEKVHAFAETSGLVNSTKIAGVLSQTIPVAQRTQ